MQGLWTHTATVHFKVVSNQNTLDLDTLPQTNICSITSVDKDTQNLFFALLVCMPKSPANWQIMKENQSSINFVAS